MNIEYTQLFLMEFKKCGIMHPKQLRFKKWRESKSEYKVKFKKCFLVKSDIF